MQTNIYDFLDKHTDPILEKMTNLKRGEWCSVNDFIVTFNAFGSYEIESAYIHESFKNIESCYTKICEMIQEAEV